MRGAIGCAILFLFPILAQASGILIDTWNTEKGLPDSSVTSVVQTSDGYLWVGTYNGLARFDGVRFVTFDPGNTPQLKHFRIQHLFVDTAGTLWINTYDGSLTSWRHGVFTLEYLGDAQKRYEASIVSPGPDHLTFAFIMGGIIRRSLDSGIAKEWQVFRQPTSVIRSISICLEDKEGAIWFRSMPDQRLWRVVNGNFELMSGGYGLYGQETHCLALDPEKRLWVVTEREIAIWNGKQFESVMPTGAEKNLNDALLFFSRDGHPWLAANGELRKWDNQWSTVSSVPQKTVPEGFFEQMNEDRQGGLWFLLRDAGLLYVAPDGSRREITIADGLPSGRITCWYEDREGNIWLGLAQGGLACVRQKHFQIIGSAEGLPAPVAVSVCEDHSGAMWIGTFGNGLIGWKNGQVTHVAMAENSKGGFICSAYPGQSDEMWVSAGTEDLFLVRNGIMVPAPCQVHGIKALFVDHRGRVWMGRHASISRWAGGVLRTWNVENGFEGRRVSALAEDPGGAIWAGAHDGSVYKFTDDTFQRFQAPDFPVQQAVWSLLADGDGTVWIGTSGGGILRLKDGRFSRFTTEEGLPDNVICQMLDDQQGNLWVGSHRGIFCVAKSSLNAFAAGSSKVIPCVAYGREDGLPTLECSGSYQPAAWRSHDGRLWFTTAKGVVSMQPSEITRQPQPPLARIEELSINGAIQKPVLSQNSSEADSDEGPIFQIEPGKQNFEFHYTGLSFAEPENIQFRYRLSGLEKDWVEAGTRRSAQYGYLSPGTYRFHVMARSNDGVWSPATTAWTIRVLPYFWQTRWFLVMSGLIVVAVIGGTVHLVGTWRMQRELQRLESQRALEQDRARIARDIHDDLGSGLTRIKLLSELLRPERPDLIPQITKTASTLLHAMDEVVWAVNPKNDTLENLMNYICAFAQDHLGTVGMRCRLDIPAKLPDLALTSEIRHHLFLATKEILHNVVKHSGATEVFVRLKLTPEAFHIIVEDNGKGCTPLAASPYPMGGNGWQNIRQRLREIGGHCQTTAGHPSGTHVELIVPIK